MIYTKPRGISNGLQIIATYIKRSKQKLKVYQMIYTKTKGISNDLHKT